MPRVVPVGIEDPSGRVVPRVREALERAGRGEGTARLTFYGASHTASDQYTGFLRERLQRRFGDAGAGLVLPAAPFALYAHHDVVLERAVGWQGRFVRGRSRAAEPYGRAGFALDASSHARARIRPQASEGRGSRVGRVEVWALGQPGGGGITLSAGGRRATLDTARGTGTRYASIEPSAGAHVIELAADGAGPVRVFGVLVESGTPGVIVEAFGVPGARAGDQLPWDARTWGEQLARRPPDLVAFAYGTNESGLRRPLDVLERELRTVLARARRAAPNAACLVIGPSDWPERAPDGTRRPRARSSEVAARYRQAAFAEGCGFFDLLALQGGPGGVLGWVAAEPPLATSDHVHLTDEGHARVAEALERALLGR